MKYVIANCSESETTVFVYETENQEELFKFINAINGNDRDDEFEIEVWEYPKDIPFETMMNISTRNLYKTISFYDLWQNELLGRQILGKYTDLTDKINVLSEDNDVEDTEPVKIY